MAHEQVPETVKDVQVADGTAVVTLTGEVDMSNSPGVHQTLVEILQNRPDRLLIDLGEVSYMDSSGVGVLVDALRRMRVTGGKLGLIAVTPRVKSVLQITKLDQFFEIFPTRDEAMAR